MSLSVIKFIGWVARIFALLFTIFIALFATEAFNRHQAWQLILLAFFMQLIPAFLVLVATLVAWYKPNIGGWLFVFAGFAYTIWAWQRFPMITFCFISVPLMVIGILFILQSYLQNHFKSS